MIKIALKEHWGALQSCNELIDGLSPPVKQRMAYLKLGVPPFSVGAFHVIVTRETEFCCPPDVKTRATFEGALGSATLKNSGAM